MVWCHSYMSQYSTRRCTENWTKAGLITVLYYRYVSKRRLGGDYFLSTNLKCWDGFISNTVSEFNTEWKYVYLDKLSGTDYSKLETYFEKPYRENKVKNGHLVCCVYRLQMLCYISVLYCVCVLWELWWSSE